MTLKILLKKFLETRNLAIIPADRYKKLLQDSAEARQYRLLKHWSQSTLQVTEMLKVFQLSQSQLDQEAFVLAQLEFKNTGFFVEAGAADGISYSNTLLLERNYHWNGVLVEPAAGWQKALRRNRNCIIEKKYLAGLSGETVSFFESEAPEYSTATELRKCDAQKHERVKGLNYKVKTISMMDLLNANNAPKIVDYMSLDTEGSEFEILSTIDFEEYKFRVITCEHNFTPRRQAIYKLLTSNGYERVFSELSSHDDWYVYREQG